MEVKNLQSKKILKELIKIITTFLIFLCILFLFVCNAIYSFAFLKDSYFSREKASAFIKSQTPKSESAASVKNKKVGFFYNECESLYINSSDNLKLHAVLKNNPKSNNKFVIVCHGYFGDHNSTLKYAKEFYNMGYSILCPDARAHGESEGEVIGMGYLERGDILLWINKLLQIKPNSKIALFGVSMGAATVLMTSGEEKLPANVKAIISDCAYSSVYDEVDYIVKNMTKLHSSFLTHGISAASTLRGNYSFHNASCVKAVKKSCTPTLFIHGDKDNFVPFYMLNKIYQNAACQKQKLVIKGASHAGSAQKEPETYWNTIKIFLNRYIKQS